MNAELLREELLVVSDEQAEALRLYLEEEETRRRAEELLERRLMERVRELDFAI